MNALRNRLKREYICSNCQCTRAYEEQDIIRWLNYEDMAI